MKKNNRPLLAFSIDFESFTESMQESFIISDDVPRFEVEYELERNAEACLEQLSINGIKATFFMLGWIGEKFPRIVKRIAAEGHEIGSHSFYHKRLSGLRKDEARVDIMRSKSVLENLTGRPVLGFRAPDFSLAGDGWILDYLVEIGFRYDSSSVPTAIRDDYGKGWTKTEVNRLPNGLIEFPIPTKMLAGRFSLPVGGGGYFRLFPFALTQRWLATVTDPLTYLHPYEIGGVFPSDISMSFLRLIRHTYNNGHLNGKLAHLFASYSAVPIAEYLRRQHDELFENSEAAPK